MFLLSLLVMIVIVAFIFVFIKYIKPNMDNVGTDSSTTTNNNNSAEGVIYDDFQIHFMMLGNDKAGDSIYIKAGDTDILIDAGSRKGSSQTTLPYMNQYVKDNKLEYVIMTHGDQDHIEAFPNILNTYSADTIIYNQYTTKTTNAYKNTLVAFNKQKIMEQTFIMHQIVGIILMVPQENINFQLRLLCLFYIMNIILKLKVMKIIILFAHCLHMILVLKNTISCLLVTLNVKVKKQWLPIMMVRQRKNTTSS